MTDDTLLPFDLPAVRRKKLTAGFDGGRLSSDGGLLLLREAERRLGIADRLAGAIRDRRDPSRVDHKLPELLKTRMFAIACGYEDANDLDRLRHDPLLKLAVGRCPESGDPLCSQSTMSRLENMPSKIEAARLTAALIESAQAFRRRRGEPPSTLTILSMKSTAASSFPSGTRITIAAAFCRCTSITPKPASRSR
jgi:Transposase DDE domain group 1